MKPNKNKESIWTKEYSIKTLLYPLLLGLAVYWGVANIPNNQVPTQEQSPAVRISSHQQNNSEITYKIRSGDTLKKIARQFYNDERKFDEIAAYNGLSNPDLIIVGYGLRLPTKWSDGTARVDEKLSEVASSDNQPQKKRKPITKYGKGRDSALAGDFDRDGKDEMIKIEGVMFHIDQNTAYGGDHVQVVRNGEVISDAYLENRTVEEMTPIETQSSTKIVVASKYFYPVNGGKCLTTYEIDGLTLRQTEEKTFPSSTNLAVIDDNIIISYLGNDGSIKFESPRNTPIERQIEELYSEMLRITTNSQDISGKSSALDRLFIDYRTELVKIAVRHLPIPDLTPNPKTHGVTTVEQALGYVPASNIGNFVAVITSGDMSSIISNYTMYGLTAQQANLLAPKREGRLVEAIEGGWEKRQTSTGIYYVSPDGQYRHGVGSPPISRDEITATDNNGTRFHRDPVTGEEWMETRPR